MVEPMLALRGIDGHAADGIAHLCVVGMMLGAMMVRATVISVQSARAP